MTGRNTNITITGDLYSVLNQDSLNDLITGSVYRIDKPLNSELEDIVINCPAIDGGYKTEIQNGYANINIYAKDIQNVANISRLDTISQEVLLLLTDKTTSNELFTYNIEDIKIFKEIEQESMSFLNIKLKIHKF